MRRPIGGLAYVRISGRAFFFKNSTGLVYEVGRQKNTEYIFVELLLFRTRFFLFLKAAVGRLTVSGVFVGRKGHSL